jgi:hypothetical protein
VSKRDDFRPLMRQVRLAIGLDRSEQAPEFLEDIRAEVQRAETVYVPLHSLHEAYAVILEELDELWDQVRMKDHERDPVAIRKELIQIAAMAWRTAKDLGYE